MKIYRRRFLAILTPVLIVLITMEVSPFLVFPLFFGNAFSPSGLREEVMKPGNAREETVSPQETDTAEFFRNAIHPYLGFTSTPVNDYNRYGFLGHDPMTTRSGKTVNICITGGSVAKGLYTGAGQYLKERLQAHPAFRNKTLNIVLLALGGYKQPQQLLALAWFLALGAEYDVVINLDGFNEIVLPYADNLPFSVNPSYPRNWNLYARRTLDPEMQMLLARQTEWRTAGEENRMLVSRIPWRYSNFLLMIWKFRDNAIRNRIALLEEAMRVQLKHDERSFRTTGVFEPVTDTIDFFRAQAASWARASLQMNALCRHAGTLYFHFLQPNQYVTGSKPLTDKEMAEAYEEGPYDYRIAVEKGYRFLISEGRDLRRLGVRFTDLTGMFSREKRTVYNDKCCHFNDLGYRMICDIIAGEVIRSINQK